MPGAILGAGALGVLGGVLTNEQSAANTAATNAASLQMQQQAEAYNTQMSDTAYQRGTADMRAAGINPMLAYMQGGASSPTAPMASLQTPQVQNAIGAGINSASDAANLMNSMKQTDNQKLVQDSQIVKNLADTDLSHASAQGQSLRNSALDSQLGAIKSKADYDQKVYDTQSGSKMFIYDQLMQRLQQMVGIGSSAAGLSRGFSGGGGGYKTESYGPTGEMTGSSYRSPLP